jgi:hypothetical protein
MTLTEILRLEEKYLKYDDLRALDYCEKRWQQAGKPTERWQLINFLEKMLRELQQNGISYPKVLLLRKKEIQRRTFRLPFEKETDTPQDSLGDEVCLNCIGRGFLILPGGEATLCEACLGRGRKISANSGAQF